MQLLIRLILTGYFFVTGDDGTTYFSTNLKDHEAYAEQVLP
jgi:cell division protein YceG involved in septum cleavage